ncbi:LysM peptidoglycan-binding domain-containing protein [Anoxybacterium hadale]|uniref:LysM peptidoglycan-binding domain-containing protein n=1 Tax=Anoxybacterium hadale TaxID=3408580 RepID=A0ACD1A8R4_9FIRM|nr:LysM peptidoglycan-binding domain-containing protein [Clostridiales bacterium]
MLNEKKIRTVILTAAAACCITLSSAGAVYADSPAVYTVVKGDSLFKIGQVFFTDTGTLMKKNNLTTSSLNIGQELKVSCRTYTVKKGDSLYLLSQKFKISLDQLRKANNLYTDTLNIGQVLNLPGTEIETASNTPGTESETDGAPGTEIEGAENTSDSGTYTQAEIDLLSRLIHAEAQGESYETKVAVGAVVVNRMESGLFPTTINGVIYQNINGYYQFTPVVNGWINKLADDEAVKAASEALEGADPSKGALFYYDTGTTNQWILSKPVTAKIGNMVFAL